MFGGYNYDFNHDDDKPKKLNYIKTRDIFKVSDKKIEKDLRRVDDDKKKEVIKLEKEGYKPKTIIKKQITEKMDLKPKKKEIEKKDNMGESPVARAIKIRNKLGNY